MVKITNGVNIFEVTRGAFDGVFSRQGYQLVEDAEVATASEEKHEELSEEEKFVSEVVEKPISQWSKEEVKRFAVLKGINIAGTKNANEAKELIKEFLAKEDQ